MAWQKDSSWGSYQVTTLHEYEPVIMKNAIIYSDNIYFAKAALKIGSENFMNTLNEIGFNQNMPFEIAMQESTYSNTDKIETEIQLADSGYGELKATKEDTSGKEMGGFRCLRQIKKRGQNKNSSLSVFAMR